MKWAKNFTVGKLLRDVSCIKISTPESMFNIIYDKDMLNLVINKTNLLLLRRDKRENPSELLVKSVQ